MRCTAPSALRAQRPPLNTRSTVRAARYPLADVAFPFVRGLMQFFYGHSLGTKVTGVLALIRCSLAPAAPK